MQIISISHRGLKRLIEDNNPRELSANMVPRIRRIVTALVLAEEPETILGPPGWRIHQLTGDRAGTWSISVTGNWRMTFRFVGDGVVDLNLEDYH